MRALDRKLGRDLLRMRGQVVAICLVIACGMATFVMSLSTLRTLDRALSDYYDQNRFAQVFARLKRAPEAIAERLREVPGVARVQTRVVADVTLDVPGLAEPAAGRLISLPEDAGLNTLHLRAGRNLSESISKLDTGEVLVGEAFAAAHNLQPGDHVSVVIQGRWRQLTIVGIVLSPEYVFQLREGEWLPDDKRFGVFWMRRAELAAAFDMDGAFNDVSIALSPGADQQFVIDRVDAALARYGGLGAVGRSEQQSHRYVADELSQLRGTGLIPPAIFLAVSAFLLNVVLSRMVRTEREQIAALRAFGYTPWQIAAHYLKLTLLVIAVGTATGTAAGGWLGLKLTDLYSRFYRFPRFEYRLDLLVVLAAAAVSAAAGIVGVVGTVRRAAALPPAEAMRPESPPVYRPSLVERIGLHRLLPASARMILRHLERTPFRAALASLGIAMAVAILVLGFFIEDTVDYVIHFQFHQVQRQDLSVAFIEPTSTTVTDEMSRLPQVLRCEPFRALAVRLRNGNWSRRVGIMGLPPDRDRQLHGLLDDKAQPVPLPEDGLLLSMKLAELLHVQVGDMLDVDVLEGERPTRRARVAALINEFTGTSAYMDLQALNRLSRQGDAVSGAMLAVDPAGIDSLYAKLKATPRVASVTVKAAALQTFQQTIAQNQMIMRTFNVIFAAIICVGVVYNTARVSLSERSRELATLRVLGFSRGEISAVLLGELAVLTLFALPVGLAIGYGLAALSVVALDTETHRFPLVIEASTYSIAAAITVLAAAGSAWIVRRHLNRLDMVAVLKSRD